MRTPVTFENLWEVYPSRIKDKPTLIGGPIREAMDGTAYKKVMGEKLVLRLEWDLLDVDELQFLRIVWARAREGAIALSCTDPLASGNFVLVETEWPFERLEGGEALWVGALTFMEK